MLSFGTCTLGRGAGGPLGPLAGGGGARGLPLGGGGLRAGGPPAIGKLALRAVGPPLIMLTSSAAGLSPVSAAILVSIVFLKLSPT